MAAIPLRDVGKAIFVTRPRRGGVYLKRFSYPKGYAPPHLKSYMDSFTKAAGDCRGVMAGGLMESPLIGYIDGQRESYRISLK